MIKRKRRIKTVKKKMIKKETKIAKKKKEIYLYIFINSKNNF